MEFQRQLSALIATEMVADRLLDFWFDAAGAKAGWLAFETDAPIDDLMIGASDGGIIAIQTKTAASLSLLIDPSPINRSMRKEGFPAILTRGRTSHETQATLGRTGRLDPQRARGRGASAADLARMHGVAEQPVHRWKSKYAGMTAPDLKRRVKENLRLKR